MSKEIVINVSGDQSRIAIVENDELVELYVENPENVRTIGDIYLAKVRRILPGIKAAFVDIGQKQDAFLHFSDLSDNVPELLELAEGKIKDRPKVVAKAPSGDPDALELETPEEQLATRRRREVKRARGDEDKRPKEEQDGKSRRSRGRRSRGADPEKAAPTEAAPTESTAAEAPSQAKAPQAEAAPEEQPAKRRRSRSRRSTDAEATPPPAPAILPPDAPGASPTPAAETEDAATEAPADDATAIQPARSRRRRGRRGRSAEARSTSADAPDADDAPDAGGASAQPADEKAPEAKAPEAKQDEPTPHDEAEPQEAPRARRGGRRKKAEAAPETAQEAPAEKTPTEEKTPAEKPARSRRKKTTPTEADEATDAAPKPKTRGRSKREAPPAEAAPSPEASSAPEPETPTSEAKPEPSTEEAPASGPPRLAPSSRFRIDLTARSGSRREEEEEEEERTKSSRGRRSGRSNRGRSKKTDEGDSSNGNGSGNGRGGSSGRPPESYLKHDQRILVKIIKEPIGQKGSRVSTDVSLAGRFLVLIPAADYVAVSKKIESSKERRRLRALARSLLPEGFGLIVRTVADGRDAKALDTDLRLLLEKWYKAEKVLKKRPEPPVCLYEDVNMVSSIVRDLFSEDYDRIVVDDPTVFRNVKSYVQAVAPHMADSIHLYKGSEPVFRKHKIERDVRAAFEKRVSLPGGGYLFIETTEAMHVVDVNSGRAGKGMSQEANALKVNLEAAREIAKQLRLRDLGGIICVDFIDMRSDSYRKKVYDELKREFRRDRAVTKLLPMSDFGVVEITRQRLRPSITTTVDVESLGPAPPEEPAASPAAPSREPEAETVPAARGATTTASEVVGHLERWLEHYREEVSERHRKRPILVRVHPFLAAYLHRGIPSLLTRWRFKTWLKLKLDVDESADPLSFSVRDEKSSKNLTRKYDPDRES